MTERDHLILVTGATGQQGGATARALLRSGHRVRAMTRKPESSAARALAALGAEIVSGDLDDADSLRRALKGAWGVYGVQNTWEAGVEREEEQGKRLAQVAREAEVQHYVYASVASAHRKTGIPHFDNKWRVEETIARLGFPSWTVVRPVFFMENFLGPWFKPGIDQGQLLIGLRPTTVLQMIAVRDIGEYGRIAFERHAELNGRAVDIAGDALTMPQAAALMSRRLGRPVVHVPVPIEEIRKASVEYAIMLEWFEAVGYDADIEANARAFGVRPTRFADWVGAVM
jgi:uncharacterized protein YbjT (DUF2867 family)